VSAVWEATRTSQVSGEDKGLEWGTNVLNCGETLMWKYGQRKRLTDAAKWADEKTIVLN